MDGLDDQLVVGLVDQPNGGGPGLHDLGHDLGGAVEHLLEIAGVGEEQGDAVQRGHLVDALAELVLLVAKPGDGVGQEEQELDGRGLGGRALGAGPARHEGADLLGLDLELLRQRQQLRLVHAEGAVGGHADRA